jgi:hypothetical protein
MPAPFDWCFLRRRASHRLVITPVSTARTLLLLSSARHASIGRQNHKPAQSQLHRTSDGIAGKYAPFRKIWARDEVLEREAFYRRYLSKKLPWKHPISDVGDWISALDQEVLRERVPQELHAQPLRVLDDKQAAIGVVEDCLDLYIAMQHSARGSGDKRDLEATRQKFRNSNAGQTTLSWFLEADSSSRSDLSNHPRLFRGLCHLTVAQNAHEMIWDRILLATHDLSSPIWKGKLLSALVAKHVYWSHGDMTESVKACVRAVGADNTALHVRQRIIFTSAFQRLHRLLSHRDNRGLDVALFDEFTKLLSIALKPGSPRQHFIRANCYSHIRTGPILGRRSGF